MMPAFLSTHAMLAQATQPAEQVTEWLQYLRGLLGRVPTYVWVWIIIIGGAWIVLRKVWTAVWREIRRRRPAQIHPSLQKYSVDKVEIQRRQRELAGGIVATSTSNRLAGYRLLRQVEAVFVEGFSSPEDALIALKAAAVERGANAILNVSTQHTAAGRCTASGDAVLVAALVPPPARTTPPAAFTPRNAPPPREQGPSGSHE